MNETSKPLPEERIELAYDLARRSLSQAQQHLRTALYCDPDELLAKRTRSLIEAIAALKEETITISTHR